MQSSLTFMQGNRLTKIEISETVNGRHALKGYFIKIMTVEMVLSEYQSEIGMQNFQTRRKHHIILIETSPTLSPLILWLEEF